MRTRGPVILFTAMVLAACGTMEPNSKFSQAATGNNVVAGPGDSTVAGGTVPGGGPSAANPSGGTVPGGGPSPSGGTVPGGGPSPSGGANNGGGGANNGGGGAANFASDVGVTANTITIGNVTGVSGALGPNAFGVTLTGLKVWVAAQNALGGINGRRIILQSCDDSQDSSQNLTCTQQLIPKVFAFISNNSLSSSVSAHAEYQAGIPDLGFPLNNGYFKYPNMFSTYGTDYPRDGKQVGFHGTLEQTPGIYKWFAQHLHVTRAAVFFYSQQASQQQGKASESDAKSAGINTVYEGGGSSGENLAAPNFDSDVLAMKNMGANAPQVIFDAMDTNGNEKLCQSMDRFGFTVAAKVSTIEVWTQQLGTPAWSKTCRNSVYVATSSLSYADTGNPEVAKYAAAFAKYAPGALQSEFGFQGYANGQIFADAVASMGANVTRKGFIGWLANLPPLDRPDTYNDHGLLGPISFRVDDPKVPRADCNVIAQWQDTAGTFVTRAPLTPCYEDPLIPTAAVDDGS